MRYQISVLLFSGLLLSSNSYSQIWNRFSIELNRNITKVINTREINSFEARRLWRDRDFVVDIQNVYYPITYNANLCLGFSLSKNHQIRIRRSKTSHGSILTGGFQMSGKSVDGPFSFFSTFSRNFYHYDTDSWGIIYEYNRAKPEGTLLYGIGVDKNRNDLIQEILQFPGIYWKNYSLHSYLGYLVEILSPLDLSLKLFGTYFLPDDQQLFDRPIDSAYVPLLVGFEIGFRVSFENIVPPGHLTKSENKRKRRKRK